MPFFKPKDRVGYSGAYLTQSASRPPTMTGAYRGSGTLVTTTAPNPPRRVLPDTPRTWPRGRLDEMTYILGDLGLSIARFIWWTVSALARLVFAILCLAAHGVGLGISRISGDRVKQRAAEVIGWLVVVAIIVTTLSSLSVTRNWFADHWPHPTSSMQSFLPAGACAQMRAQCVVPTRMLNGLPSISAATILSVLQSYHSPAANQTFANQLYDLGIKYGINPAYALGFFAYESQCGTQGMAVNTDSVGNVRFSQSNSPVPYGDYMGFRKYRSWRDGAEDWYWVIRTYYINQGLRDIFQVTPIYAPTSDNNDPQQYAQTVYQLVQQWGH
jgi:hypothetical protein